MLSMEVRVRKCFQKKLITWKLSKMDRNIVKFKFEKIILSNTFLSFLPACKHSNTSLQKPQVFHLILIHFIISFSFPMYTIHTQENGKALWNGLYIQACKKYSLHLLKADHILLGLKRTFLADAGFALNLDRHSLYLK